MKTNFWAIASLCVAAVTTSSVAHSQDPIKRGNLGTGFVFGVNHPGDANSTALKPDFGDRVETSIYAPNDDSNKDLGLVKGGTYTMLMLTGKEQQQAFIYWETPDPSFQDILLNQSTKIDSIGRRGFELKRGDRATIQAQRDGDKINVTFSFSRGQQSIGTVSFNLEGKAPASTFPKGYFYMTTKYGEERDYALESDPLDLRKAGNFTGMLWKAIPAGDGYYFLTTKHLEERNLVLEGGDGRGGSSVMVPNKGYTGTQWKILSSDGDHHTLTNRFLESKNQVLSSSTDVAPRMVSGESDNSKWRFVPVDVD